jgi:hypothetical protein
MDGEGSFDVFFSYSTRDHAAASAAVQRMVTKDGDEKPSKTG